MRSQPRQSSRGASPRIWPRRAVSAEVTWLALGVGLIWFLAYRMEMANPVHAAAASSSWCAGSRTR